MKKLILLVSFIFCSLTIFAQIVETGTLIINCSDMPLGTFTDIKRRCPVPDHYSEDRLNRTVYQRFEVAEHNYQNTALGTDRPEAKRLCANYSTTVSDMGKWRLPTQRELILIWILEPSLMKNSSYTAMGISEISSTSSGVYYSATVNCNVDFTVYKATGKPDTNYAGGGSSDNQYNRVRCVRDLDIK